MKLLLLFCLLVPTQILACGKNGFSFEFGVGVHDPSIDGPEYITPNFLAMGDLRYTQGPFIVSLAHTSSLRGFPKVWDSPGEDGYGANVLSVRYKLKLFE